MRERFLAQLAADPCAGVRIETAFACYEQQPAVASFYWTEHAALLLLGDSLLISGTVEDAQELKDFCAFARLARVEGGGVCPQGFAARRTLCMARAVGAARRTATPFAARVDLWKLSRSGLLGVDADAWYADACARRNRGLAEIWTVCDGEDIIATAGVYARRRDAAYISAVATRADHRGRGLASGLVQGLADAYGDGTVTLRCTEELRPFYERLGFFVREEIVDYAREPVEKT
ncbi:MAG: GNAT family N-acetyltransferase [Pygmaiobacter sp.]